MTNQNLESLSNPTCTPDERGHCITCSDEVLKVRVLQIDPATGLALAEWQDSALEIDVSLLDSLKPGDLVLVQGGVALAGVEQ
jgi:hypothetical protein